jgi:NADPH-dependent 2,4-dienoyl-CoA reductase/sulfur reductase-like enzyme
MSNRAKNKTKQFYNVVIVGSGFSGIVAAGILAEYQLSVLVVDENMHVGGQLLRKIPDQLGDFPSYRPDYVKKLGFSLVEQIKKEKITVMNRTCVLGIYPGNRIMLELERKEILEITYDTLLFATGARERYLPFKGWTLPGVYSTGMVQVLMKSSGILPAKNILVGGSGLFLFSVAYEILKNKGKVPAVLEQSGMLDKIKIIPQLFHQLSKFAEGAKFMSKIFFNGVPVKFHRKIVEARGDGSVEEVVVGKVDSSGKLLPGSEKIYKTDALAVGYGFVANIEGPQQAGCDLEYSQSKGGWTVKVNDGLETSVENILAAGEITGIGGAFKSLDEGKIAAATILKKFGKITETEYRKQMKPLTKKRRHHLNFAHYFNSLYPIQPQSIIDIPDETTICRCEDITMAEVKEGIAAGYDNPKALKSGMRVSMGNCQGRTCGPIIYDIVSAITKQSPETTGIFNVRPPLKPVSIEALASFQANASGGSLFVKSSAKTFE